jgi:hypothetical protein
VPFVGDQLSWSIAEDVPEDLHGALFARDTLALGSVDGGFPTPLADAVPDLRQLVGLDAHDREAAALAWAQWWRALVGVHQQMAAHPTKGFGPLFDVYDPPDFRSLSATPALQRVVTATFPPFHSWWNENGPQPGHASTGLDIPGVKGALIDRLHGGEMVENDVVAAVERRLGQRAQPFHLTIDFLAVTGHGAWPVDDHYAMLALNLRDHRPAFVAWLEPVVMRLA